MCSFGKTGTEKKLDGFQEAYGHSAGEDVSCYKELWYEITW